jgi:FKBP-type peptidyl-prolyl cis-trans isomerase FkpA
VLKIIKFSGLTVSAGLVVGVGIVGWIKIHPGNAPVRSSGVSQNSSISASGSGLSVISNNGDSMQGVSLGGQSSSSTPGAASSAGSSGGSSQLPSPDQFSVYDQYSTATTALYIDTQPGTGATVTSGSVVTMEYSLWLTTGQEIGGTAAGKPYTFTEGANVVIPGVEEAMYGMKAGGQRRLIVPPAAAYGSTGKSPVPPNAVLIFDVTLVSVS